LCAIFLGTIKNPPSQLTDREEGLSGGGRKKVFNVGLLRVFSSKETKGRGKKPAYFNETEIGCQWKK